MTPSSPPGSASAPAPEQFRAPEASTSGGLRVLVAVVARLVLGVVGSLLIWAAAPTVLGWHATTVMTGSMLPRIAPGDLTVARPVSAADLHIGQVLLYDDPDHPDRLRLHRFVRVSDAGELVTRGDANPVEDSTPVDPATVVGVGTLRIPYVGLPRVWWDEGHHGRVLLLAAAVAGLLAALRLDPGTDRPTPRRQPAAPRRPAPRRAAPAAPRRAAPTIVALGASALLMVAAVGLPHLPGAGSTAFAAYTTQAQAAGSTLAAAPYYKCASAVTADAPGIYWKLNETTGTTAADSSGNARNGTYRGSVTLGSGAACARDTGTAATLNGSTGYVSLGTSLTTSTALSVELWFKTTTTRGGWLVGFGSAATGASTTVDRVLYLTSAGRVQFGINPSNKVAIASTARYNDGVWHHALATQSTSGMRLYVDGELVASGNTAPSGSYSGYLRAGYDTLAGWPNAPTSNFFAGSIDEVAAYGKTLTAADAADHAEAGA